MSRIPESYFPAGRPINTPSALSRLSQGLLRVAALVTLVAIGFFVIKAFMSASSSREVGEAKEKTPWDLSPDDSIQLLVQMAEGDDYNYAAFEKIYLRFITEGMEGFDDAIRAANKEKLIDALYANNLLCKVTKDAKSILLEDINTVIEKKPGYQYPNYAPPNLNQQ